MRDYSAKRPMLTSAIISCAVSVLSFYSETALFIVGIGLVALFLILLFRKHTGSMLVCIAAVLAVVCSCIFTTQEIKSLSFADGAVCSGEFIVISEPQDHGEYYSVQLETKKTDTLKQGVKIYAFYDENDFFYGDIISAEIGLSSVGDSEFKASNYSEEIYFTGSMRNISVLDDKEPILSIVGKVRSYIKSTLFSKISYSEAATLCAVTFGDRAYFSNRFYSNVKAAGVSHVMVVSGMHLAVIVSLFTRLSEKLFYNKYFRAFLIFAAVLVLTAVCGFTKSVIRAGVNYMLVGISLILNRVSTPENTLGGAVTIILTASPFVIFSISFQLSVLATFGILVVAFPIIDFVKEREIIISKPVLLLFSSVTVSLGALLMTLPVAIYVFGYVSTVSLITNLLISNVVTWTLSVTVSALIINLFAPFLANLLFFIAEVLTRYINAVINLFGSLPFSVLFINKYAAFIAAGIIILILVGLLACKRRINMIKLEQMNEKMIAEGGGKLKWRQSTRKHLKRQ